MDDNNQPVNTNGISPAHLIDAGTKELRIKDAGNPFERTSEWLRRSCLENGELLGPVYSKRAYWPHRYHAKGLCDIYYHLNGFSLRDIVVCDRRFNVGNAQSNQMLGSMQSGNAFILHPNTTSFHGFGTGTVFTMQPLREGGYGGLELKWCVLDCFANTDMKPDWLAKELKNSIGHVVSVDITEVWFQRYLVTITSHGKADLWYNANNALKLGFK